MQNKFAHVIQKLQAFLAKDETIVWVGQPQQHIGIWGQTAFPILGWMTALCGLLVVIIFIVDAFSRIHNFEMLGDTIFVLIIITSPFVLTAYGFFKGPATYRKNRAVQYYLLTSSQVLIVNTRTEKVHRISWDEISRVYIAERKAEHASLIFLSLNAAQQPKRRLAFRYLNNVASVFVRAEAAGLTINPDIDFGQSNEIDIIYQ